MVAREVLTCAHIDIVVLLCREHAIDGRGTGEDDGCGREAYDLIGVVGGGDGEVLTTNTTQRKVPEGKLHRRVRLQADTLAKAIEVQPCYAPIFIGLGGLTLHDRGKRRHLQWTKTKRSRLLATCSTPEG